MKKPTDVRSSAAEVTALPEAHAATIALYSSVTAQTGPIYTALAVATLP
jgi:hypothetical protein